MSAANAASGLAAAPSMRGARLFLAVGGGVLAVYGVLLFADPALLGRLVGLAFVDPNAPVEIRAFYGGLELALGGLICALALSPARRRDALILSAVVYLGIGLARLSGLVQYGADGDVMRYAMFVELDLGVGAALLAWRTRS
jgi:hypothetical protein